MTLKIPGINFSSERDAGSCVIYSFAFASGAESKALDSILNHLVPNSEVSVPDPTNGDCSLEVRRTSSGLELKRGCHGASGTWRSATLPEALSWLLPGAVAASTTARPGFGGNIVLYKVAVRG